LGGFLKVGIYIDFVVVAQLDNFIGIVRFVHFRQEDYLIAVLKGRGILAAVGTPDLAVVSECLKCPKLFSWTYIFRLLKSVSGLCQYQSVLRV
jgi:hypothetical protein